MVWQNLSATHGADTSSCPNKVMSLMPLLGPKTDQELIFGRNDMWMSERGMKAHQADPGPRGRTRRAPPSC